MNWLINSLRMLPGNLAYAFRPAFGLVVQLFTFDSLRTVAVLFLLALSSVATGVGLVDLVESSGAQIDNFVRAIIYLLAATIVIVMWILLETARRAIFRRSRLAAAACYLVFALWSVGFGVGFYYRYISADSVARADLQDLDEGAARLLDSASEDLSSVVGILSDARQISIDRFVVEATQGNSCNPGPRSLRGPGPIFETRTQMHGEVEGLVRGFYRDLGLDVSSLRDPVPEIRRQIEDNESLLVGEFVLQPTITSPACTGEEELLFLPIQAEMARLGCEIDRALMRSQGLAPLSDPASDIAGDEGSPDGGEAIQTNGRERDARQQAEYEALLRRARDLVNRAGRQVESVKQRTEQINALEARYREGFPVATYSQDCSDARVAGALASASQRLTDLIPPSGNDPILDKSLALGAQATAAAFERLVWGVVRAVSGVLTDITENTFLPDIPRFEGDGVPNMRREDFLALAAAFVVDLGILMLTIVGRPANLPLGVSDSLGLPRRFGGLRRTLARMTRNESSDLAEVFDICAIQHNQRSYIVTHDRLEAVHESIKTIQNALVVGRDASFADPFEERQRVGSFDVPLMRTGERDVVFQRKCEAAMIRAAEVGGVSMPLTEADLHAEGYQIVRITPRGLLSMQLLLSAPIMGDAQPSATADPAADAGTDGDPTPSPEPSESALQEAFDRIQSSLPQRQSNASLEGLDREQDGEPARNQDDNGAVDQDQEQDQGTDGG